MMDLDSPSNHSNYSVDAALESPSVSASTSCSSRRMLFHHNMDFSFNFSSLSNKENIPTSSSSNSLYKSLTFNGNPSLSRNSSIKKHTRKKSSISISNSTTLSNSQKLYPLSHSTGHNHNHNHSHSHSHSHNNNHGHNHSHNHHHGHKKSSSSNSIFKNLTKNSTIDSIFNFNKENSSNRLSTNHPNKQFLISSSSVTSTPLGSELGFYSDDEDEVDDVARLYHDNDLALSTGFHQEDFKELEVSLHKDSTTLQHSTDNTEYDNINELTLDQKSSPHRLSFRLKMNEYVGGDNDEEEDDEENNEFGSPLQRKNFKKLNSGKNINKNTQPNPFFSKFNLSLQRHQSLMQFDDNKDKQLGLSNKFDTDQLTSNIKGLCVTSEEDVQTTMGNSLLNDVPFQLNEPENCYIPRISVTEFKKILKEYERKNSNDDNKFCKHFDELVIVDCRFKFEYDGGHIEGAVNVSSNTELEELFFNESILKHTPSQFNLHQRKLLIFHCEFSSHRGPMKAKHLRALDRHISGPNYPNLYYPDVLVLEGGYKDYYDSEKSLKKSLSYIEMDHPFYEIEKERNLTLMRKESGLSRKNSYNSSKTLSRKNSPGSIKSFSSSILDFSSVNKVDLGIKYRSNKRLDNHTNISIDSTNNDLSDDNTSSLSTPMEDGIFGGFGNHPVDLESLIDEDDVIQSTDFTNNSNITTTNSSGGNVFRDPVDNDDIDDTTDKVNLNLFNRPSISKLSSTSSSNDGFKIPLPRPRINRKSTRSNTVGGLLFANTSGFVSAPILSTPEKDSSRGTSSFHSHNHPTESGSESVLKLGLENSDTEDPHVL